jgi:hypothetical protein
VTAATKLLPCPFCGGEGVLSTKYFGVYCIACGAEGARYVSDESAVKGWNKRHGYVQGRTMNDAPALFRAIWDGGGWKGADWNIYHGETLAWVFFQKAAAAMLRDSAPFLTEEEIKALSLISGGGS